MNKQKYESSCQQRILRVLLTLFGHEVAGLAPGELARLAGITPQDATRDLANLHYAGIAEQAGDGRWRLTPMIPQKALAAVAEMDKAKRKIEELSQRYTRAPH